MSVSSDHHITLYACGHVQSQCRCPGPKAKHVLTVACAACKEAFSAQDSYRSSREVIRLASYLMEQHGGPTKSESAVDMAIRLLGIKADLERTLTSAHKALGRTSRELATAHELHGTAIQALGALTAALAPSIAFDPADPLRLACRVIETARRDLRAAVLRDRAHLRGMLKDRLPATVSIASAIDDVFERAAELDRMGEEVLAGTTVAHLKGCPDDQPRRVEYSRLEVRVSPRVAEALEREDAEEQP